MCFILLFLFHFHFVVIFMFVFVFHFHLFLFFYLKTLDNAGPIEHFKFTYFTFDFDIICVLILKIAFHTLKNT